MIEIKEDYVSFETAKLLKEKGFDEKCRISGDEITKIHRVTGGNNSKLPVTFISAPTLQMAMKGLREVHKLHITVYSCSQESWAYRITKPHQALENGAYAGDYASCEEACEAAVKYCLKNLI